MSCQDIEIHETLIDVTDNSADTSLETNTILSNENQKTGRPGRKPRNRSSPKDPEWMTSSIAEVEIMHTFLFKLFVHLNMIVVCCFAENNSTYKTDNYWCEYFKITGITQCQTFINMWLTFYDEININEFREYLKALIEIIKHKGYIVIYKDEIHVIPGGITDDPLEIIISNIENVRATYKPSDDDIFYKYCKKQSFKFDILYSIHQIIIYWLATHNPNHSQDKEWIETFKNQGRLERINFINEWISIYDDFTFSAIKTYIVCSIQMIEYTGYVVTYKNEEITLSAKIPKNIMQVMESLMFGAYCKISPSKKSEYKINN